MFSKRTCYAIHAGRFSRLHFLKHRYTFVGDDYWWHRCRSIQRSQMARDRNYMGAPINYYQAVCHPHETINSVAPVHRRADKLSRPSALLAFTHPSFLILLFYVHIFFLQYSRRYLTTGRLMKISPIGTGHSSRRQDSDVTDDLFVSTTRSWLFDAIIRQNVKMFR